MSTELAQLKVAATQFLLLDSGDRAAAATLPQFDSDIIQIRPGLRLVQRLNDYRTAVGGRELRANLLQTHQHPVFVAVEFVNYKLKSHLIFS